MRTPKHGSYICGEMLCRDHAHDYQSIQTHAHQLIKQLDDHNTSSPTAVGKKMSCKTRDRMNFVTRSQDEVFYPCGKTKPSDEPTISHQRFIRTTKIGKRSALHPTAALRTDCLFTTPYHHTFTLVPAAGALLSLKLQQWLHGLLDFVRVQLSLFLVRLHRGHSAGNPAQTSRCLPSLNRVFAAKSLVKSVLGITTNNGESRDRRDSQREILPPV